jgi:hypothetical protein
MRVLCVFVLIIFFNTIDAQVMKDSMAQIQFDNRNWLIKKSRDLIGPGNNLFGLKRKNCFVDSQGNMHLRILKTSQGWSCAEIISAQAYNGGLFEFEILSDVNQLDDNVVLGLFLYTDNHPPFYDEIDIEFSRWGEKDSLNAQYVVHHDFVNPSQMRFNVDKKCSKVICRIFYSADKIEFTTYSYYQQGQIEEQKYSVITPESFDIGETRMRINYWLYRPLMNPHKKRHEVIISKARYINKEETGY